MSATRYDAPMRTHPILLATLTALVAACGDGPAFVDGAVASDGRPRDAASVDAGGGDAASVDAGGGDAASVDAGGGDAASVDAGGGDAAGVDAASADAAFGDAMPADAAASDAAVADAVPADAVVADAMAADAGIAADAVIADAVIAADAITTADAAACTSAVLTFTMDGVLDASATVLAGGVTSIRIAVAFSADGRLYVATDDAGEGSDHFVLISATPPATAVRAPFAKAGQVRAGADDLRFLADENDNGFTGWFRLEPAGADTLLTGAAYTSGTGANGGVVEGTIDLAAAWGAVPAVVYLAAVPYATADGGALVATAQTPAGDGDGDVDAVEYVSFAIPCVAIE